MVNIAILLDINNDWLSEYIPKHFTASKNFNLNIFYDERKVKGFDLVFVLGYTRLLKGKILDENKLLLVIHESDLPKGRGFAPVQWQVLEGKTKLLFAY